MPIPAQCGQCGQRYQVPDQMAGKQAKCKKCGAIVVVPTPGSPPSMPAQSAGGFPQPGQPDPLFGMPAGQPGFGMPGVDPLALGQPGWGQPGGFPQPGMGSMGYPPGVGNPYSSPQSAFGGGAFAAPPPRKSNPTTAAGIGLIVAGALAMIAHLLHITAVAMAPAPPPPPANMSPAELRGYETGAAVGKLGAGCCLMFVGLPIDILIIVGGVKLMNCTSRRMANTGSVLAMLPGTAGGQWDP
jgi:hypothetical protein